MTPSQPAKFATANDPAAPTRDDPQVSVLAPVFNEEANLEELISRVMKVLDELPGSGHQLLVVDDGSDDRSPQMLRRAAAREPRLAVITLSRNFGHQVALTAALQHASGDAVVVIDGDLQDPPEAIPELLHHYAQGADVVFARRTERKEGLLLRSCYFLFYRLLKMISAVHVPLDSGDFGLLSRRVVTAINGMPERHRYLRGLRAWVGFEQREVVIERAARQRGESKYTVIKLINLALDGIFSFSLAPLRFATLLGLLAIVLSLAYLAFVLYAKFIQGTPPQGFTATILTIVFLGGVQLVFLGVLGEYLGRVYNEVKRRPHYLVKQSLNLKKGSEPGGEELRD